MRTLGTDGPEVTPLGLGLAALGRPSYINVGHGSDVAPVRDKLGMARRTHAMLDEARRLGIGYIDAARSYGLAEDFLASWLDGHGSHGKRPTVGSKWGYTYIADWDPDAETHEVKDHSIDTFERQIGETRALIGDALDVYHIHSVTPESRVLGDRAVIDALWGLRTQGVVVGVSTSGPSQGSTVLRALEVERDGVSLFGSFQVTWNLLEPSAGAALAEASARGAGVIVKEALANGRLVGDGGRWLEDEHQGRTADAVALAAAVAQPWADVVLSGAATIEHLRSNAAALECEVDLDLALSRVEPAIEYWATRSELPWT